MNPDPKQLLSELLSELFVPEELKTFMAHVPGCQPLLRDLPEPTYRQEIYFTAVATALIRYKAADEAFFQFLEEERPNWFQEIEEVRDAVAAAPVSTSTAGANGRPRCMTGLRKSPEPNRDKTRILFLAANPSEAARAVLEREVQEVSRRLRISTFRNRLELKPIVDIPLEDLPAVLEREAPRVVHFTGAGEMVPGSAPDDLTPTSAAELGRVLGQQEGLRLVVLNSCCTQELATELARHVDLVVGLPPVDSVLVPMAFAGSFYQMLAEGADARYAFQAACEVVMADEVGGRRQEPILVEGAGISAEQIFLVEE